MSKTQADALNWLQSQVGQHLDYDNKYGQQCVDNFNYYYQYLTDSSPYAHGYGVPSAKNLWDVQTDVFTKIPDSNSLVPEVGDVAIYGAAWGSGNGHVEMVVAVDGNGCTFVGENEHNNPNEGVTRVYRTWAQMRGLIGVMRPHWAAPTPTYTIEYVPAKQVKVKPGMHKWNLALPTFESVCNNPVDTSGDNTVITVNGLLRHREIPQFQYYVEDINNPVGWNTLDVDDYIPPSAPQPPSAPLVVPTSTEPYELVTSVMGYPSSNSAANDINARVALPAGIYYIYNQKAGVINITKNPGRPGDLDNAQGGWINPAQNVIPPEPVPTPVTPPDAASPVGPREATTPVVTPVPVVVAPTPITPTPDSEGQIRSTYLPFSPDGKPIYCAVLKDVMVQDVLHLGQSFTVHRLDKDGLDREIPVYGTFKANGRYYAKLKLKTDVSDYYLYGVPISGPTTLLPYLDDTYDITDRILYGVESFIDKAHKSIDGVFQRKKSIDGVFKMFNRKK